MMTRNLLLALGLLASVGQPVLAQRAGCAPPASVYASVVLSGVKGLASGTAASDSAWRGAAQVPHTRMGAVHMVVDPAVCEAASNALAALPNQPAAHAVWVVSIGPTRYLVFDVQRASAGKKLAAVFDAKMQWLADVTL
jgi:hypothetical protein